MKNELDFIILEFDLPEFNLNEIKVNVSEEKIDIEAFKKEENEITEDDFHWFEKSSRSFSYSSSLPPVVSKKAKVDFIRGRLKITIPKNNFK